MDRETKIGFACMFVMLTAAIVFPLILKQIAGW